ncbi:hypothetical protein GCM10009801_23730 [Streptomyces albiaxialis]|uniref:Uncharacterized protein n=1 Tax=Streptomyces albiaxialis TaxID=329523 RepID=A0ABN2VXD8_9ACTN
MRGRSSRTAPGAPDLSPVRDASARDRLGGWLRRAVTDFGGTVAGSLVPPGYAAYVRLPHSVQLDGDRELAWGAVAAWTGRTLDATAQWARVSRPLPGHVPEGPRPWDEDDEPYGGVLPDGQLGALVPVLAAHTGTPDACVFALWDGFGYLGDERERRSSFAVSVYADGPASARELRAARAAALPPPGLDVSAVPRLALPHRDHVLFTGPVGAARQVSIGLGRPYANEFRDGPHLWWPEDRAWVVATDIDLDSTYVACSASLAAALLAGEGPEAVAVSPHDRFDEAADLPDAQARG